jgi:AAA15 family ATPase/GTPase
MLCQFTVKNFKSFKQEITLDLQATNITEHENSIIIDEVDGEKFLPIAAIYGPNGGGKSNVLQAMFSLINKIMRPICAACDRKDCSSALRSKQPISPFRFDPISKTEPTEFEIFFRTKEAEYRYNLSVKDDVVIYESLFFRNLDSAKITEIFIRDTNENKEISLNKSLLKGVNNSGITDTLPFLSYLGIAHKEIELVKDVFSWIENRIVLVNYSNPFLETTIELPKKEEIKGLILKMIREMDIDIVDYRVEELKEDDVRVYTKHIVNDQENELELSEESDGTIKVFGLLPHICSSLVEGDILCIDELDSKIHPKLLQYIIELYRNPIKNKNGAQLIFTSHDLMTMTSELFRRDEIWFVAKNAEQSSQVYSLVEFKKGNGKKPRKDEKYGKQYFEGRYGADPYLKRMINWEVQCE